VTGRGHRTLRRALAHAALVVAAAAACTAPAQAAAPACAHAGAAPAHLSRAAADRALRCLINRVRHEHGLRAVRADDRLAQAATAHASDMATHDYFSHVSPGGSTMQARVAHAGYLRRAHAWALGEALAWGRDGTARPTAILRLLLNSPAHRAILLDPGFRDLGVGVARGAPQGAGSDALTIALDFGRLQR
jgi:uncharacterized protein YkwD